MPNNAAKPSIWLSDRQSSISDAEILSEWASRQSIQPDETPTLKEIYSSFLEVKKASDAWLNYHMLSLALLLLTAIGASNELDMIPGVKIRDDLIGPAAIVYFSVCVFVAANYDLKMRLFRALFKSRLDALEGPQKAEMLLRYPLAFFGTEFLPVHARPDNIMIGTTQAMRGLPIITIAFIAKLIIALGTASLIFYDLYIVLTNIKISFFVKISSAALLFVTILYVAHVLRNPSTKNTYEPVDG